MYGLGKSVAIGEIYNHLKILELHGKDKHGRKLFKCKCLKCGKNTIKKGTDVKKGIVKSCGCLRDEKFKKVTTKHGLSKSPLYKKWLSMKARCNNSSTTNYHRYGGRGIKVCERWNKDFKYFYDDMIGTYFDGAELDRIDNNGNYEPNNCRLVTHKENSNNRNKYHNKTGYTGVYYKPHINKYVAYFYVNRKQIHVGSFKTPQKAYEARKEAILKYQSE